MAAARAIAIMAGMLFDRIRPALTALLLLAGPAARAAGPDGAALYATNCAGCHGAHLEGQPRWWQANAAARLPAPPLDAGGHAWQHADAELTDMIANAMANVAGPDYQTDMPAFAARLTGAEITAILDFIKGHWPDGVRAAQSALNPDGGAALAAMLDKGGDWTFAPDCLTPMRRAAAARLPGR